MYRKPIVVEFAKFLNLEYTKQCFKNVNSLSINRKKTEQKEAHKKSTVIIF